MASTSWSIPTQKKAAALVSTEVPDYFGTTTGSAVETARAAKIPGADPAIFQQFLDSQRLRDTIGGTTKAYSDSLQKLLPSMSKASDEETAAIGDIYNPNGLQATLQGIRDRRAKAFAGLNDTIRADLTRTMGANRLGSSGFAGSGLNSFMSRIAAAEAGKLRAAEAADAAGQERADTNTLLTARTTASGQRNKILTELLSTLLQPADVEAKGQSTAAQALSQALQLALANSTTGLATKVG